MYSERELQAALQGERIEAEELSAEELAAKEFMQVSGIGEAVAMKLACTTELGGVKHRGLASLKAWVCASADNDAAMREYLLESEEIPGVTRKWPAWRARMVPNIMAALTGRGEIEAEDGGEGGGKERVEDLAEGAKENEAPRASAGGTADCCAQGAEGGVGDAGVVMLADATNA